MATERQIAANRANAQRSTGPRTPEGKERSSMNSVKHGCYSERPIAIPRGELAEDPEQVKAFINEIVDNLHPRNLVEKVAATEIAHIMLKMLRLSGFEAEAIAGATLEHFGPPSALVSSEREDGWDFVRERGAVNAIKDVLPNTERIGGSLALRLDKALDRYDKLRQLDLDDELFDDPMDDLP